MRGITQKELAKTIGIAVSSLWELENGESKLPAADTLLLISHALCADPWQIIFNQAQPAAHDLMLVTHNEGEVRLGAAEQRQVLDLIGKIVQARQPLKEKFLGPKFVGGAPVKGRVQADAVREVWPKGSKNAEQQRSSSVATKKSRGSKSA